MAVVEVDSPVELKIKHLAVKLKEEEEEGATVFWSSLMNGSEIAKIYNWEFWDFGEEEEDYKSSNTIEVIKPQRFKPQ